MKTLNELQQTYSQLLGEKKALSRLLREKEKEREQAQASLDLYQQALKIVREVALATQRQLEFRIANTVSAAQKAVFDEPYSFKVKFEEKRGKTECVLLFERGGQEFDPLSSSGYGAVDLAAFALRVACWSIEQRTRPVLILDEPFKHLKGEEQNRRVVRMLRAISNELALQIISVSDERAPREDIIEEADAVFEVSLKDDKSLVTLLKKEDEYDEDKT